MVETDSGALMGYEKNRSKNISTFIVYVCMCVCSVYVCVCVVCTDIFPATYEFCNLRNTKVVWSQELQCLKKNLLNIAAKHGLNVSAVISVTFSLKIAETQRTSS